MTPYGNAADPFSLRRSAFVPYAFEHERDAAHAAQLQGRRLVRSASVNSGSVTGRKGVMGRLSSCMADCAADVEDSFREGEGDAAAWGERERGVGVGAGPGFGAAGNGIGRATANARTSQVYMYEPQGRRP
uniref:Uncharacterized protein n=1 Tax=Mycena chlorophos TaxID=658473 RepID=A0ABQ0MD92_MYCCL|nr:predicted protein [Mycena chlorophos]